MEEIKRRFIDSVAAKLSAAPRSTAKDELVEELSDNLYRRFLDMTSAGLSEEAAFNRAMEDLGDVDELLSYLGAAPRADVSLSQEGDQTRITTGDGQIIAISGSENGRRAAGSGDGDGAGGRPQGRGEQHGGSHCDYQAPQSDLDAILAGVSAACNTAIDQAKTAIQQARDAIQRRTTWEKENGHVRVHFNTRPNDAPEPPEPPQSPESAGPSAPPPGQGWEFEAELNTGEGRFFAGGGPKEKEGVVYGFGYDKDRGGFFTQWGEYQEGRESGGPHFTGEDASMTNNDDGSYSVTALRDLRGIEVFTGAGDVAIHMSEAPDAGVVIDGDVDDLDVTCSADGVLTIREGRTASSSFFSRRGFRSADVELFLPCRLWESIVVTTGSGDVDIDREGLEADQLSVRTASGDLSARMRSCGRFAFHSASGDLELEGSCAGLTAETMSGDISLRGRLDAAALSTASGDIELEGQVCRVSCRSMSGDVEVTTAQLPEAMELSSKSGDCRARIPDAGPFSVHMKTISGDMRCDFPVSHTGGAAVYGGGSGPAYSITSISGDVSLERC